MPRARISLIAILLVAVFSPAETRAQANAYVRISTNYSQAALYADSLLIGGLADGVIAVPADARTLRLVPPELDSWSIAPVSRSLHAVAGDTVSVSLNFPYHYRVESLPFGAAVFIEDELGFQKIGTTPLLYRAEEPIEGNLVIQRDGYTLERVRPGREIWNRHVVDLRPSDDLDPAAAKVNWQPPSKHRAWIDYVALGAAVTAGAVAVHYKFKADDMYREYEDTGNPALRSRIEAYDLRAGVAFGTMQVGLGVFAVRLILR